MDEEFNPLGLTTHQSLIHSLRTGNPICDILIGILIPLFFSLIVNYSSRLKDWIKDQFEKHELSKEYYRTIEYTYECGYSKNDPPANSVDKTFLLQKKLRVYVSHHYGREFDQGQCKYLSLSAKGSRLDYSDDYHNQRSHGYDDYPRHEIVVEPEDDYWVELTDSISMKYEVTDGESADGEKKAVKSETVRYILKSSENIKAIDDFILVVEQWYTQHTSKLVDSNRYMYTIRESDNHNQDIIYNRYPLFANKTFKTTFIPDKEAIIKQIDEFQAGTGRFAIEGFPKQLTLLLTGPPGTGKTSLIKAIAQHTSRHVISVDTGKINTCSDLDSIMRDPYFRIHKSTYNNDDPIKYRHDQLIYVLEDIDNMNDADVVFKTDDIDITFDDIKSDDESDSDSGDKKDKDTLRMSSEKKKALQMFLKRMAKDNKNWYGTDPVSLSYILQIFDGIIESPGRIIIITSNNPEKLHPKLLRPGRINRKIYLGYIQSKEAIELMEHFVGEMTSVQRQTLTTIVSEKNVTPAMLQETIIEYINDIDLILSKLIY